MLNSRSRGPFRGAAATALVLVAGVVLAGCSSGNSSDGPGNSDRPDNEIHVLVLGDAAASAEQAELVRTQWTEAAQRTKGLERLEERHHQALQHAEAAAEERAVDDLVTGRAGRRTAHPGPGEVPWTE